MFNIKPAAARSLGLHFLKSYSAHNLNRDDLGRPKSMNFGGATRQRISSQASKFAIRKSAWFDGFREWALLHDCAWLIRTRRVGELAIRALNEKLSETEKSMSDEQKKEVVQFGASKLAGGVDDKFKESYKTQLVATSKEEVTSLIHGLIEYGDMKSLPNDSNPKEFSKKMKSWCADAYKEFGKLHKTLADLKVMAPETALFGRMMTGDSLFASVDSSIQCNHAFTTHPVSVQSDYWTAQEDQKIAFDDLLLLPADEAESAKLQSANQNGGAMLETRRFTTGVYYNYHNINLDQLHANLKASNKEATSEEIADVMTQIVGAYVMSCLMDNPSGFQNNFAANSLASAVAITLGQGFPMDASSAFENPVPLDQNVSQNSANKLKAFFEQRHHQYGDLIDMPVFSGELYADCDPISSVVNTICDAIYEQYS